MKSKHQNLYRRKVTFRLHWFPEKLREDVKEKIIERKIKIGEKKWRKIKKIGLESIDYFFILLQTRFTYFPLL